MAEVSGGALEPLSADEVLGLFRACHSGRRPAFDRALLALALDTGARRGELRSLRVELVEDRMIANLGDPECPRPVRLGLTSAGALATLEARLDGPCTPLDIGPTDVGLHERLRQLGRRAGLTAPLTVRRTRRTWLAVQLSWSKAGPATIAAVAGHRPGGAPLPSTPETLAIQLAPGWVSAIDRLVAGRSDS